MIEFVNVTKKYNEQPVISDISFTLPKGQVVVLVGLSGCGKTTTLKMINRLISPSSGKILINGEDIAMRNVVQLRRGMGYVIQQTGLFPHMTVRENIEIIPRLEKLPIKEIAERTEYLMNLVGLEADEYLDRYPGQLSGGQQQRVGVARALAVDPDIVLMDEPFSALDPITRTDLQDSFAALQKELHKSIVFVTHDMGEALKIADMICLMDKGEIVQYDTPENILKNPANEFVSKFIGKNRIWESPELIKVKDIMVENPMTCMASSPVGRCLVKMRANHVDSLMVLAEGTRAFLGVLRAKDICNEMDMLKPASDIMRTDIFTAAPDDSILDILKIIQEKRTFNIPVVSSGNILAGLLTKSSLVTTLSQKYFDDGEEDA